MGRRRICRWCRSATVNTRPSFVPTATGDYTFRISGTIGEATVDESVTSGPTTFNSVEPLSAIEFPQPRPDPVQLQAAVADANAAATTARTLGIVGIVAGVLGLILGALALARSRQPKAEAAPRAQRTLRQADSMTTSAVVPVTGVS